MRDRGDGFPLRQAVSVRRVTSSTVPSPDPYDCSNGHGGRRTQGLTREGTIDKAFAAAGDVEPGRPADIHIGDSVIMISSTSEREAFPAFLYVYVDDADEAFQRAIEAGAAVIEEPLDTPYGDR
jgi:hypothetical protein